MTDDTSRESCPFCERSENCDFDQLYAGVVMRFEPLNPVTPGHMLFMPAEHAEHPHPDALATAMRYAGKYAAERGGDYNLITSSGPAATQTVPHMHIHYVPRRQGDGLHLPWTLAAEKAKWQAEAWDEGFAAFSRWHARHPIDDHKPEPTNPYEKGSDDDH